MNLDNTHRLLIVSSVVVLNSCGGNSNSPQMDMDGGALADAAVSGTYNVRQIYDLAALTEPTNIRLTLGADETTMMDGKRIRSIEYGYFGVAGFPLADSKIGERGVAFFEVDAQGNILSDTQAMAVMLANEGRAPAGYGARCALRTGYPCVLAGRVATPSSIGPLYPSEYGPMGDVITDSNELLFNLLAEMRRGRDVNGQELTGPIVRRAYVTNIAEAGVFAITAASKLFTELGLASVPPARVVVGGHSKWGAAAAQIAAIDDRVVGAVTFGFPLDWRRFVSIAKERWFDKLGADLFASLCGLEDSGQSEINCIWDATGIDQFFTSTKAMPQQCGGSACPGTGDDWLRQLDIRTLREQGWHDSIRFALVRNGREGYAVDSEQEAELSGTGPEQFLFATQSGHSIMAETHQSLWRHWVRHSLADNSTIRVPRPQITRTGDQLTIQIDLDPGSAQLVSASVEWFVSTANYEFGPLNGIDGYTSDGSWQSAQAAIVSASSIKANLSAAQTSSVAVVVGITFDDGSSDLTFVTSPVTIVEGM